jgi:DNA-binding GntR family transcriptional regulator
MTAALSKVLPRQQTTPDLVADALRLEIHDGALPPGSPLRQEELARRFGVSRLPIRDALIRLESEGLVTVYPNRGAFVVQLSPAEVREIYELRLLIEGDVLERAVPLMTSSDLATIDRALAATAAGAGAPGWEALDRAFHLALYAPANRPRQLNIISALRGAVDRNWKPYSELPAHMAEWLRDHEDIVVAARAGDARGARDLLVDHLQRAESFVLARMQIRTSKRSHDVATS